ncbi:MAG: hypothetical protein HY823_10890 [Acidobacteria bacterium]|nr:hypothetical protein [Acidobacteriota bacterium]
MGGRCEGLLVGLVLCLGCGGGGGGSTGGGGGTPVPNQNPAGHWRGTVHSVTTGQTLSAEALVVSTGEFRYVASNWVQAVGSLSVSGASASGSGTMFGPPGFTFPGGAQTATVTMSGGQISAKSQFTGTYTGGGDTGTLSFLYQADFDAPPPLANMAGAWAALSYNCSTGYPTTASLSSSGTFTGSDAFGTITGSLSQVNPAQNLYRVTLTYRFNAGGATVTYNGLACFTSAGFLVQCSSSSQEFCALFTR